MSEALQTPQYVRSGASLRRVQPGSAAKAGMAARVLARAVTGKRATAALLPAARAAAAPSARRSSSSVAGSGPALLCLAFCRHAQLT